MCSYRRRSWIGYRDSVSVHQEVTKKEQHRMSDFQTEMNRVVQGFVVQITELAKRAAIDTLESALGRGGRGVAASFATAARNGARGRGRGAKRTSEDLDNLAETFHSFVTKHP